MTQQPTLKADKETIEECNKLCAELLGYKYYPNPDTHFLPGWKLKDGVLNLKTMSVGEIGQRKYLCRLHRELRFHSDWNWFMAAHKKFIADRKTTIAEGYNIPFLQTCIVLEVDLLKSFFHLTNLIKVQKALSGKQNG